MNIFTIRNLHYLLQAHRQVPREIGKMMLTSPLPLWYVKRFSTESRVLQEHVRCVNQNNKSWSLSKLDLFKNSKLYSHGDHLMIQNKICQHSSLSLCFCQKSRPSFFSHSDSGWTRTFTKAAKIIQEKEERIFSPRGNVDSQSSITCIPIVS